MAESNLTLDPSKAALVLIDLPQGILGAPGTIVVCGLGCVAGGIWFWLQLAKLRPALRPIYEQLGVLPAEGEAAAP